MKPAKRGETATTTEVQDRIEEIKLRDSGVGRGMKVSDMCTMVCMRMLLNGEHARRDATIFARQVL